MKKQKPDADTGNVIINLSEGLETKKNILLHQFELKKNTLSQSSHLKSPRVQLANFVWMLKWF